MLALRRQSPFPSLTFHKDRPQGWRSSGLSPLTAWIWRFLDWLRSCLRVTHRICGWVTEELLGLNHTMLLSGLTPHFIKVPHVHLTPPRSKSQVPSDHFPSLEMWSTLIWSHPSKSTNEVSQQKKTSTGLATSHFTVILMHFSFSPLLLPPHLLPFSFPLPFSITNPNNTIKCKLLNILTHWLSCVYFHGINPVNVTTTRRKHVLTPCNIENILTRGRS